MTLEELFDRPRTRQIFFGGVAVVVALLLVARYFVLPKFEPSLTQGVLPILAKVAEDLSATILVTVIVAWFLWWITPNSVRNPGVMVIEPRELKAHFEKALADSNEWKFFGGCGRYFRTRVLDAMRNSYVSRIKSVEAVILNPESDLLCEQHAHYRSGSRRGRGEGSWTKQRVKQELLATILIAKRVAHDESRLNVKIYVSDYFSSFRLDLAQTCAIETREDSTAPALKSDQGTYYYNALSDEYFLLRSQSREIDGRLEGCHEINDLNSLLRALTKLGLTEHGLSNAELEGILPIIKSPKNPYD